MRKIRRGGGGGVLSSPKNIRLIKNNKERITAPGLLLTSQSRVSESFIKLRSKHNKLEGTVRHCACESKRIDQYKYESVGFQKLC